MSLTSRIDALRQKHSTLSAKVEEAAHHPGTNTLEVAQMKKEKLQLKQEIERLSNA